MRHKLFGLFSFLYLFAITLVYAEKEACVKMFSPQETVKGLRQVSVRFSGQRVPFGDPRGFIDPFDKCPLIHQALR